MTLVDHVPTTRRGQGGAHRAVIHGWVPTDFYTRYAGADHAFGVLVAVGIGVPLYSNAAGVMPLVETVHDKGLPMGTLLAFMSAVEKRTRQAMTDLGLDATVEKVSDYGDIASYGVTSTPGLVVDGQLVVQGRVPGVAALGDLLARAAGR